MNISTSYILISILAFLIVAVLVFFISRNRQENHLTPMAGLAFGFIVAGILFGENRFLGYGLIAVGVIIAVLDIFRGARRKQSDNPSWLIKQGDKEYMDLFTRSLQDWQFFFTAVASASATLTGLLFVSLSLNRDRLKGEKAHITLSIACNTFGDFLYVLMIGLVFLVPHLVPLSLTVALLVLGIASEVGVIIREAKQYVSTKQRLLDARLTLRRIGLPAIASLGQIVVAIEIALNHYNAIYGLVGVIAALHISACWNAWLSLVE